MSARPDATLHMSSAQEPMHRTARVCGGSRRLCQPACYVRCAEHAVRPYPRAGRWRCRNPQKPSRSDFDRGARHGNPGLSKTLNRVFLEPLKPSGAHPLRERGHAVEEGGQGGVVARHADLGDDHGAQQRIPGPQNPG